MSESLSLAIVGCGAVANAHLHAYRGLAGVDVVAVVEPDPRRRASIVEEYGVAGFASCEEMLRHVRPEAAWVLSPASTHRANAEILAGAGVHVFCEKPMAVTLEDAHAMKAACDAAGVQFGYGSSYRYLAALRQARELIASGAIGEPRVLLETAISGQGARKFHPMSSAHYPVGGPGGGESGMVDHGIHLLDIFPWLVGSGIVSVLGAGNYSGQAAHPEYALLKLRNGALGFVIYDESTCSSDLPTEGLFSLGQHWVSGLGFSGESGHWQAEPGSIRVHGSEGSLRIFHYANRLFLTRSGEKTREIAVTGGAAPVHFAEQLMAFRTAVRRGHTPDASADDGLRALTALHAVYRSAREERWIRLEL